MFGLKKIATAVNRLLAAINGLADSLNELNDGLRTTCKLPAPDAPARKPRRALVPARGANGAAGAAAVGWPSQEGGV